MLCVTCGIDTAPDWNPCPVCGAQGAVLTGLTVARRAASLAGIAGQGVRCAVRTAEMDPIGRDDRVHSRIARLSKKIINACFVNASLMAALVAWAIVYLARPTPDSNVLRDLDEGWRALAAGLGLLGVLLAAMAVIPVRRSLGSWIEYTVLVVLNGTALAAPAYFF